jgi:hypothetical protein
MLIAAATPASSLPRTVPGQVANDAAWTWFSEPRAVQSGGTTYLGWISSHGDITVGAVDAAGHVTTSVIMSGFQVDDHDDPAILLRPDGRVAAFWSGHDGRTVYNRVSTRAGDISGWGPVGTVPLRVRGDKVSSYTNPVLLPGEGNRLYVFGRSGDRPAFTSSGDLGRTWSPARALISVAGRRPYAKYADNGSDTIGIAFTNGHPRNTHSSIYFTAYRGGTLRHADGRLVCRVDQLPIAPAQADLVYAAPPGRDAWVHDVAYDRQGQPRIVFATIPESGVGTHDYWYAAWTGSSWQSTRLTDAGTSIAGTREPAYSAGISLDHAHPEVVVLSRPVGSTREISRWSTPDLGRTWISAAVTTRSAGDNIRPVIPRGGSGRVVWMTGRYDYYTSYATGLAMNIPVLPAQPLPVHARSS